MQACVFRLDNWIKMAGFRVDRKVDLTYEVPDADEQPEDSQTQARVLAIAYTHMRYAYACKRSSHSLLLYSVYIVHSKVYTLYMYIVLNGYIRESSNLQYSQKHFLVNMMKELDTVYALLV